MQNTVKFNLKKALANPELVVYRNGEKPKEWHWVKNAHQRMFCVYSIYPDGDMLLHTINGSTYVSIKMKSNLDLMLIAQPKRKPAKKK